MNSTVTMVNVNGNLMLVMALGIWKSLLQQQCHYQFLYLGIPVKGRLGYNWTSIY